MNKLIENHLDDLTRKSKLTNVYIIEYKGEQLILSSHKYYWKTLSGAKNALRYELYLFCWKNKLSQEQSLQRYDIIEQLEKDEIIKYVKIIK